MVQGSYAAAQYVRSMSFTLVAAYLSYMAFFGLYANLWTRSPLDGKPIRPLRRRSRWPQRTGSVVLYSGESSFSKRIEQFILPGRGFAPDRWSVDMIRFNGDRPDLAMVKRRGRDGSPELHVLSGEHGFQRFVVQTPIELSPSSGADDEFLAGSSLGRPAVYALDHDARAGSRTPELTRVDRLGRVMVRIVPAGEALGPLAD